MGSPGDLEPQMKRALGLLQDAEAEREELRQRCQELDLQVHNLNIEIYMEAKRADTLTFDMTQLWERQEKLEKENERLIVQRDALKEINEELRCSLVQQDHLNQSGESSIKNNNNLAAALLPVGYGLNLGRVEEMQLQIVDLQKSLQNQGSEAEGAGSNTLKKKIKAQMEKLKEVHDAIETKKEQLEDLEPEAADQSAQRVEELEAALRKKDEDMKAMEDRYKIYLEKDKHEAQRVVELKAVLRTKEEELKTSEERYKTYQAKATNVIKTLEAKLNPTSAEIQSLRKKLTEKERRIENLERGRAPPGRNVRRESHSDGRVQGEGRASRRTAVRKSVSAHVTPTC